MYITDMDEEDGAADWEFRAAERVRMWETRLLSLLISRVWPGSQHRAVYRLSAGIAPGTIFEGLILYIDAAVRGYGGRVELAVTLPLAWRLVRWFQRHLAYNGRRWTLAVSVHALQWCMGVEYERLYSGTRWLTVLLGPINVDIVRYGKVDEEDNLN